MGWPSLEAASPVSVLPSTAPHPGQQGLTWEQEGGPGGDVDLLQMLQSLSVEEADGGAGGEGHPDSAARLHHVRHAHGFILVRLEALLRHRRSAVRDGPAGRASGDQAHPTPNPSQREGMQELRAKLTQPQTQVRERGCRNSGPSSPNPEPGQREGTQTPRAKLTQP